MIVGGEFIHANIDGDLVGECMYAKWWWWWGDYCLCEHMHWVESYVHAFMTDGGGFYI